MEIGRKKPCHGHHLFDLLEYYAISLVCHGSVSASLLAQSQMLTVILLSLNAPTSPMKILHVAHALPSKRVTNKDLINEVLHRNRARFSGNELKEIEQRMQLSFRFSGTEVRYHRAEGEKALTVGLRAGKLALERSGVSPTDLDLLI